MAKYPEPFEVIGGAVIDADTIYAERLHIGFGVELHAEKIRAADYDAWESKRYRRGKNITDEELRKGRLAANELRELLAGHRLFAYPVSGKRSRGSFGRLLANFRYCKLDEPAELSLQLRLWMRDRGHIRK